MKIANDPGAQPEEVVAILGRNAGPFGRFQSDFYTEKGLIWGTS